MKLSRQAFSDMKQEIKRSAIRMFADANPSDAMLDQTMQDMGIEMEQADTEMKKVTSSVDAMNAEIDALVAEFEKAKSAPDIAEGDVKDIDMVLEQLKNLKEELATKFADIQAAKDKFIKEVATAEVPVEAPAVV
jgi:chromosome segregation ATPase